MLQSIWNVYTNAFFPVFIFGFFIRLRGKDSAALIGAPFFGVFLGLFWPLVLVVFAVNAYRYLFRPDWDPKTDILSVLANKGDWMTTLEVHEALARKYSAATVITTLSRLQRDGFVIHREEAVPETQGDTNRIPRDYYRITDQGRRRRPAKRFDIRDALPWGAPHPT